jgi:dTDP-4-dehydrorhamnose 3,5-epimerase
MSDDSLRAPEPLPVAPAEAAEERIDPQLARRLRTQTYERGPVIKGVAFHDLRRCVDDSGALIEITRLTGGTTRLHPGFEVRQVNYSVLEPGVIKAFHLHLSQSEMWFVPPDAEALVGLVDARLESPTRGASMRFVLGAGQPRLLFLPPGVAHGISNPGLRTCPLLYLADREFSPEPGRCDEHRLPWDLLGPGFWDRRRD